ncbi:MAG TPA: sigma 54-interacting transcriptional regulator [Candidatus Polarisedimenticolaceae bacterium]|nr:sigma 54-interacting transcriptional regulator [Candidatus Polarisedimenticolaceae bacterium]
MQPNLDDETSPAVVGPAPEAAPEIEAEADADPFPGVLSRIARIVSGTLELKAVFTQVADVAHEVLPFETMGVCRLEQGDLLRRYAVAGEGAECEEDDDAEVHLSDFSPAMRPRMGKSTTQRCNDAERELDPAYPMDKDLLECGVRSLLCSALASGDRTEGVVWFTSGKPGSFTPKHEGMASSIADILSLSLEHERLWSMEATRRQRLDAIDTLLPTIAGTLDVRGVFHRVSEIVQPVLPHAVLILTTLSADRRALVVDISTGDPEQTPTRFPAVAGDPMAYHSAPEYLLVPDAETKDIPCPTREDCRKLGMRSVLGIPMSLDGGTRWLLFLSLNPHQYSAEEDVTVARRVADHVSLALSHQRLAEEERRAAEARDRAMKLEERVQVLTDQLENSLGYRRIVGDSEPWKAILGHAAKVAQTETTVLLTGESGTGKEVLARFIHRGSPRAKGPFVGLNCAALPETLLESELFGHEKGAFTGATAAHPGRIEQAAGGVLFLDEVAEMSPNVQAKLLRVLQEKEYQRLGATRPTKADVRIVAATNKNLERAMARGDFREDLYYRLHVFEIRLPALRERRQDIVPMAEAFLEEVGAAVGRKAAGISTEAMEALLAYDWPGNVRELRNALERATILCDGGMIEVEHLPISRSPRPSSVSAPRTPEDGSFPLEGVNLDSVERGLIINALQAARNNRSRAARLLGITRSQLYTKLQKYRLDA